MSSSPTHVRQTALAARTTGAVPRQQCMDAAGAPAALVSVQAQGRGVAGVRQGSPYPGSSSAHGLLPRLNTFASSRVDRRIHHGSGSKEKYF